MKRILVITFFLLIGGAVMAQGGFRIGGKGGVAFTMFMNNDWNDDPTVSYIPSFAGYGGLSFGYNMTYYNMGFTLGFFYKQYNMSIEESKPRPSWRRDMRVQYLEVPVLFRLRPAGDKVSRSFSYGGGYFEVGLQPMFLLGAQEDRTDTLAGMTFSGLDTKRNYSSFNAAGVIGFGFHQVGTEHVSVTHGLRFSYAFLDAIEQKNYITATATDPVNLLSAAYILSISYKF